jgi:hypothetical protein
MSEVMAFVADDGSCEAWVFGPGTRSARRVAGKWVSPAPTVTFAFFMEDFTRLDDAGARALLNDSRAALPEEPGTQVDLRDLLSPTSSTRDTQGEADGQASPERLLRAAKDYRARVDANRAITKAAESAKKALPQPPDPREE